MKHLTTHRVIGIIVIIAALLLVFQAGVFVGYHKATFSFRGDNRYFALMEGGKGDMMSFANDFGSNHGAIGRVVSVSLPSFVVAMPDNSEKTVTLEDNTIIRRFRDAATSTDIQTGQYVVVLGEPNETGGTIEASFVRLMPSPQGATSRTSSAPASASAPVAPSQK